ncbi:helix-turn-helix domain-containing protein [Rhodopila sp.]|uniref:helix-turn-helix domain-containing protein n=1 Tax=Rhodopila sp. TaxID=2480087 RepID=UPI002B65913D|nr:helix-turn-helix transcriptional regulator [Rhodopila sp.]HVZ06823.1 helix-turn-helix transcriptional regulator [Rhodopila sp.]
MSVILTFMVTSPTTIGARLRQERIDRGMTQDQLARRIGVSRSAIAQWETGRAGQLTGNLARIAAALDTGVEFLMYGKDKQAPLQAAQGDEVALLRLYRECAPDDRQLLLRMGRRLARRAAAPAD